MNTHFLCPVCSSQEYEKAFICPDHSISKENFTIGKCKKCSFTFTLDAPSEDKIGKYYQSNEYISHSDTSKGFINKLYRIVRNITIQQKVNLINTLNAKDKTLLDIGCGTGYFLQAAKTNGWIVCGMEPDNQARKSAEEKTKIPIHDSIEKIPQANFHIITLWHVLEHIHRLNESLEIIKNKQKQGDTLIIAVPNHLSWDSKHYQEYWAAYDVPRHLYHFDQSSIRALLKNHGYTFLKKKPMLFDSIYVSMLSEKYKNGSSIIGILKGIWSNLSGILNGEYSSHIYIFSKNDE
ncbi:MAG: class I SAM-dependent methyltransferase [Cytophagaceae bacterium]|jgi:SAM-dependent methyltransferase|nr:class I SAM-dependent methyltransferase [Cytophagaceae bacterium]